MKYISTFLLFSLLSFMPGVALAHEGHLADSNHHHLAESAALIFSVVLGFIIFAYYRQK